MSRFLLPRLHLRSLTYFYAAKYRSMIDTLSFLVLFLSFIAVIARRLPHRVAPELTYLTC